MKYLDKAGLQRLWAAIQARGGASMASWHELMLADSYDTGASAWGEDPDLGAWLTSALGLASGEIYSVARPKGLVVTVGEHTWTTPDADHTRTTTADVTVTFPDGSSLTKAGVTFSNYTRPNARAAAACLAGTPSGDVRSNMGIDTGLTLDYGYEFRVTGYTPGTYSSALLGALVNTSTRTTFRLLGGSNYAQHMWPSNKELRGTGINFRAMCSYVQNKDGATITQGETVYEYPSAGTQSGTNDAKIILFNETLGEGQNYNGVLVEAEIRDGAGNVLRHFEPWWIDGELVIIDTANSNQIYRPVSGGLAEVAI